MGCGVYQVMRTRSAVPVSLNLVVLRRLGIVVLAVGTLIVSGCGAEDVAAVRSKGAPTTSAPSTTVSSTTTVSPTTTTSSTTARPTTSATAPPTTTTTTAPPPTRDAINTGYSPYATSVALTLVHPAATVERIGFHQSNHEGAQDQSPAETAARSFEMDSRDRIAGPRTAADVVIEPGIEIRAPVTGVVNRASAYTLYCDYTDEFVVINPDAAPELEVKLLHVQGLSIAAGDRVVAGETVVAAQAHKLPFDSQVDKHTAEPSWPHVHIEVVDPSIPNVPNGGSGSGCS